MSQIPEEVIAALPPNTLPKGMKYQAQIIWLLDPNDEVMRQSSLGLHAKRVAAGDGDRTILLNGLNPDLDQVPDTDNIRLYVLGHGTTMYSDTTKTKITKFGIRVARSALQDEQNIKDAGQFLTTLKLLIQKTPRHKVNRISLFVCNSAGFVNEQLDGGGIPLEASFANLLTKELCPNFATDITARRGKVNVTLERYPKADVDSVYKKKPDKDQFLVDGAEVPQYIVSMKKKVDRVENRGTYVFSQGKAGTRKDGYEQ